MSATPETKPGKVLIFDIETDAIVDRTVTALHCICIRDLDTPGVMRFRAGETGGSSFKEALSKLHSASLLVGHNIQGFDLAALRKLFGWEPLPEQRVFDTLLMCRLAWPDIKEGDFRRYAKGELPANLIGAHSLEAWGWRIGVRKGDYGKQTDWSKWTVEMEDYCAQDVEVTATLYQRLLAKNLSPQSVELEHSFAKIIREQEERGFKFNSAKAGEFYAMLAGKRLALEKQILEVFPPTIKTMKLRNWVAGGIEYPSKKAAAMDGHKAKAITPGSFKTKSIPFNPASRDEIAERLIAKYSWKPEVFTEGNKPKLSEDVLESLPYPEAKLLAEILTLDKRMGQLADGKQGLIRVTASDGRIHGGVITNGAVTGRCAHVRPNMAQIPKVGTLYGKEFRELLEVPPGFELVGADASGLELRCLAHFMAKYDGGEYIKVLLEGDVHTVNQKAAGLLTRDQAKTFIYAFLYGAGDAKIGSIVAPDASPEEQQAVGKRLKARFLKGLPALKMLKEAVKSAAERGFLVGLDGRIVPIRSEHAALNTLLQGAGAVAVKMATIIFHRNMRAAGITLADACLVAHVHDEFQTECRKGLGQIIGPMATKAITLAGEHFNFRCPLAGEFRIGQNWAETH